MGVKDALTQLEIIATNMVGRLAETHDEREAKIISKQIEALDMGIDALKKFRPPFAKWIKRDKWLYCSACDGGGWGLGAVTYEWQYCPLCGAKIGE